MAKKMKIMPKRWHLSKDAITYWLEYCFAALAFISFVTLRTGLTPG